jgi:hypothetical protein
MRGGGGKSASKAHIRQRIWTGGSILEGVQICMLGHQLKSWGFPQRMVILIKYYPNA